ncbi:MAG: DEAD/DEAH box helicase [Kangiellaceae bacterium]|nr:DEAD/DEAH box helicase [Kangiellaceae bacterium]
MNFDSLGLSKTILSAISEQGYTSPSPIQLKAIPAVLDGKDVMAAAQTGTGKTAGYTLPILEKLLQSKPATPNNIKSLILAPTRELAIQVGESVATYGKNTRIRSAVVYGGVKINPQMMKLRKGVEILIATPGRLLDLFNQNAVKFDQVEVLVLDEADRMLDMGFIRDIRKIISKLPQQRQNLLFSATFSNEIRALAKELVNNPVEISVTPRNSTVKAVSQLVHPVDKKRKSELLSFLIGSNNWQQVLVFTRTKHGANRLTKHLIADGIKSMAIHGNKSQGARVKALNSFKDREIQVLVATDIAARGIDIEQLPHVINFDLPNVAEDYVHRIGRTGRAGKSGEAISLVSADEFKQLAAIEKLIQKLIERKLIDGFEPNHDVPTSRLDLKPNKPNRAKKPKRYNNDRGNSSNSTSRTNKKENDPRKNQNKVNKNPRRTS